MPEVRFQPEQAMGRRVVSILTIATLMLLAGCGARTIINSETLSRSELSCQSNADTVTPVAAVPLKEVRIGVDGSGSMLGYVTPGQTTYTRAIDAVNSVVTSSLDLPIQFERVGGSATKLTYSNFQTAKTPGFYDGSRPEYPQVASQLSQFFAGHAEGQLSLLLTDLQPSAADVTSMTREIRQFLEARSGMALAIVGIKSEFAGQVYLEEGGALQTFEYNTSGKDGQQLRPAYLVMLGPYGTVSDLIADLLEFLDPGGERTEVVLFSPDYLIQSAAHINTNANIGLSEATQGNVIEVNTLEAGGVVVDPGDLAYRLFLLRSGLESLPTYREFLQGLSQGAYTPAINWQKLSYEAIATQGLTFPQPGANNPIQIENLEPEANQQIQLQVTLQPNAVNPQEVTLVKIQAYAQSLAVAEWWQTWDWSTRTGSQDGSKTYNLLSFLQEMSLLTLRQMDPESRLAAELCFAVGRR